MATESPVFPMAEPHHFSDYGFDPQFDYFQVLEEAKRQPFYYSRSIDTLHFKLQKPFSKDDPYHITKKKKSSASKKRRWWKNALQFIKSRWAGPHSTKPIIPIGPTTISGPIYITESLSLSRKGEIGIPYVSLRELNMDPPPMPIYLVT